MAVLGVAASGCFGARVGSGADSGAPGGSPADGGVDRGANAGAGGGCTAAGAGGAAGSVQSATIVVDTPSGQAATETLDGYCDLLEAVQAANTDRPVHECAAGCGADRIVLAGGSSYPLAKTLRITGPVAIGVAEATAGGAGTTANIVAAPGFVTDTADRLSSCMILARAADGVVRLSDVSLSQPPDVTLTGACVSFGALEVRRARVTGFRKGGIAAYCLPELGCNGGAAATEQTTLAVLGSLISENRSPVNGGGVSTEGAGVALVVEHSAVIDNVAQNFGGGLYFGGAGNTQRVEHSTISGNAASNGAGIMVGFPILAGSSLSVSNSTISRNVATYSGGGLEFHGNTAQALTVVSSIIAGNTSTTSPETDINTAWSGGHFRCARGSLIFVPSGLTTPEQEPGPAPCRFDVADPVLTPLARMGGTGNLPVHVPRPGSPALDAAIGDEAMEQQRDGWIPLYDQSPPPAWMVFERVVDGDGDGTAVRDLGAYEVNDVWQTELLAIHGKGPGTHAVVIAPMGYQRGAGTAYAAGGGAGDSITYLLPVAEAGGYEISVRVLRRPDGGQLQAAVADGPAGPWIELGPVQDTFATTDEFATLALSTTHTFGAAGAKLLRFTVVGKNAASTGHVLNLDAIRLRPLP